MNETSNVAIIGDSVLVEGIAVSLDEDPSMTVLRLQECQDCFLQQLIDFRPDVVVFPLGRPELEATLSQLRNAYGVRFVGLDLDCNQALVIDSKLHFALSMESIRHLIMEEDSDNRELIGRPEKPLLPLDSPAVEIQSEAK